MANSYYKQLGVDYDPYLKNKSIYENAADKNSSEALAAASANSAYRDKYGLGTDTYSYNDLVANEAYNKYLDKINDGLTTMERYSKFKDAYSDNVLDSYRDLKNFDYNPDTDPAFNAYKEKYARESDSAQKQALSNLTGITGGRNNSWASAATAQVGQAYAQKASDMIPQLAQRAYNILLQRYNADTQMSDSAYKRNSDMLNNQGDLVNIYNKLAQQEYNNNWNDSIANRTTRDSDQAYDYNDWENELKKTYLPQQYETAEKLHKLDVIKKQFELDKLPIEWEQAYLKGNLTIEQLIIAIRTNSKLKR